jgi:hypothetical protein
VRNGRNLGGEAEAAERAIELALGEPRVGDEAIDEGEGGD